MILVWVRNERGRQEDPGIINLFSQTQIFLEIWPIKDLVVTRIADSGFHSKKWPIWSQIQPKIDQNEVKIVDIV